MTSDIPEWASIVSWWVKPEDWKKIDDWEYNDMVERPDWRAEFKSYTLAVKESPSGQLTVSRCDEACVITDVADQASDLPSIFLGLWPPPPPYWAGLVAEWVDPDKWSRTKEDWGGGRSIIKWRYPRDWVSGLSKGQEEWSVYAEKEYSDEYMVNLWLPPRGRRPGCSQSVFATQRGLPNVFRRLSAALAAFKEAK